MISLIENEKNKYAKRFYKKLANEGYELVYSTYKKAKTHVTIRHIECGYEYKVTPDKFNSGRRCPECFRGIRKTQKEFEKEVEDLVGDEYIVTGNYINARTYISLTHNNCGHNWNIIPDAFLRGNRCPLCSLERHSMERSKTHEEFLSEVKDLVGDEYQVLSSYVNSNIKVKMKHTLCGYSWSVKPSNFTHSGRRCPECATASMLNKRRMTNEEFQDKVYELEGDLYTVLSDYKDTRTHVLMKHNECGHIYSTVPNNFVTGRRCPHCSLSVGEKIVKDHLKENGYNYIIQDKFEKCKNIYLLPFDFGVYSDNDDLICLIEYQGIQHYEPVDFAGRGTEWAKEQFKNRQRNDNIKRKFCIDNDIPLIEIHYSLTKQEIKEFLQKRLKTYFSRSGDEKKTNKSNT